MLIITGMARTGTSLTAKIFEANGAKFGSDVNHLNEHKGVKRLLKRYLTENDYDPRGQDPLPDTSRLKPYHNFRRDFLDALGDANTVKEHKLCLIWPLLLMHIPEARYVIVERDEESHLDSLMRTNFMSAYNNKEGWKGWIDAHKKYLQAIRERTLTITINPSRFVHEHDWSEMDRALEFAGLPFNKAKSESCIDRSKYGKV